MSRLKTLDVPYKSAQCARFVKNVIKDREKLFLFVELDIESTNNRAERAIRPVVIARKISGGSGYDNLPPWHERKKLFAAYPDHGGEPWIQISLLDWM